jgi:hypothetical protein
LIVQASQVGLERAQSGKVRVADDADEETTSCPRSNFIRHTQIFVFGDVDGCFGTFPVGLTCFGHHPGLLRRPDVKVIKLFFITNTEDKIAWWAFSVKYNIWGII